MRCKLEQPSLVECFRMIFPSASEKWVTLLRRVEVQLNAYQNTSLVRHVSETGVMLLVGC